MPDADQPTDDAPEESTTPGEDEALYDDAPVSEETVPGLAAALQPTDEDYGPFDPRVDKAEDSPPTQEEESLPDKPVQFDPRLREEFEGLVFIGALTKRFTWLGHKFVIRTLSTNEVLEIGLIQQPYVGTMGEIKAYQAAVVAASLLSVDGRTLPMPLTDEVGDTVLGAKFRYVIDHYSPTLINVLYEQLVSLEIKVDEVLAAMGKA